MGNREGRQNALASVQRRSNGGQTRAALVTFATLTALTACIPMAPHAVGEIADPFLDMFARDVGERVFVTAVARVLSVSRHDRCDTPCNRVPAPRVPE